MCLFWVIDRYGRERETEKLEHQCAILLVISLHRNKMGRIFRILIHLCKYLLIAETRNLSLEWNILHQALVPEPTATPKCFTESGTLPTSDSFFLFSPSQWMPPIWRADEHAFLSWVRSTWTVGKMLPQGWTPWTSWGSQGRWTSWPTKLVKGPNSSATIHKETLPDD